MEQNISKIVQHLYWLRIWRYEKMPISNFHKFYQKCIFGIFYVFFGITLAAGAFVSDSLTETVYLCVVLLTLISVSVNLLTISSNQSEIELILCDIAIKENSAFPDVYEKSLKFTKFVYYFKFLVAAMSTFAIIFPLSQGLLPYAIWFPLDWKHNTISYWITILYCLISHGLNVITLVYLRLIVWFVMFNASLQYEILGKRFKNLGQQILDDSITITELKDCVVFHRRVKR